MLRPSYPFYLANAPEAPNQDLVVTDKFTGAVATRVALARAADIDLWMAHTQRYPRSANGPHAASANGPRSARTGCE